MAKYLDIEGLTFFWEKIKRLLPLTNVSYKSGNKCYSKLCSFTCSKGYLNYPVVLEINSRGYSSSCVEFMLQSSSGFAPGMVYFKHRIKRYDGSHGTTSNVGYTYQDVDGIRTYKIWKLDNEPYGNSAVRVIAREGFTSLFEFNSETETTAPDGIVWADKVLEGLSSNEIESWNGKLNADGNNSTSATSNNIFNNSAERPDGSAYDVAGNDVVLVQDVKNGTVGLPRRTTVGRLLSNVDSNVRALANNKFDKENIVQNLNASNEDKVPSQKAVRNAVSSLDNSKQNKLPLDQDGETYNIHVKRSDIATAAQKDEDNNVIKTTYLKNENLDISSSGTYNGAFIGACISIMLGDDVSSTQMNVAAIVENRILSQYRHKCKTFHVLNLSSNDITVMGFADGSTFKLLRNRGTTIYSYREGSNYEYYRMDL